MHASTKAPLHVSFETPPAERVFCPTSSFSLKAGNNASGGGPRPVVSAAAKSKKAGPTYVGSGDGQQMMSAQRTSGRNYARERRASFAQRWTIRTPGSVCYAELLLASSLFSSSPSALNNCLLRSHARIMANLHATGTRGQDIPVVRQARVSIRSQRGKSHSFPPRGRLAHAPARPSRGKSTHV